MGSFTLSANKDGQPPRSYTGSIPDADIDRALAAVAKRFFPNGVLVPGTAATETTPAVPDSTRPPTTEELFSRIVQNVVDGINDLTVSVEREAAQVQAQALLDAVKPLAVAPIVN